MFKFCLQFLAASKIIWTAKSLFDPQSKAGAMNIVVIFK